MLKFILENDLQSVYYSTAIMTIGWLLVVGFVFFDFRYGIMKAKHLKEDITSEGYKRSIRKMFYYFSILLLAGVFDFFDAITPFWLPKPLDILPVFSIISTIALCYTEHKSIHEKADEKARRRTKESASEFLQLFEKHSETLKYLNEKLKEEKTLEKSNKEE